MVLLCSEKESQILADPWITYVENRLKGSQLKIWTGARPSTLESLQLGIVNHRGPIGLPGGSDGQVSACNVGDLGLIPGLRRSPGEGSGNPLQYSYLENPMDRGAWWATFRGVAKSQTWLSKEACGSGADALPRNDQAFEMYGRIINKTESGACY